MASGSALLVAALALATPATAWARQADAPDSVAGATPRIVAPLAWAPVAIVRRPVSRPAPRPAGDVPPGGRRARGTAGNLKIVGAVEATAFAITWVLPDDISKWDKSLPPSYYLHRAYSHPPVWDQDHWFWNWIVHPVAGQQAYLLERNEGRGPWRGFLVATAASVGWEYGFEAFIEKPSAQDLLITSPVGSLLGELSWVATRRLRRGGVHGLERPALLVVNPGWVMRWGFR